MDRIEVIRTILRGLSSGTNEGDLGRQIDLAVEGSGVPTDLRHGVPYEFDGERLARARLFVDPAEPFRVAGLEP